MFSSGPARPNLPPNSASWAKSNCNTQRKLLSGSFLQAVEISLADEAAEAEAQQLQAYGNSGNTTVSVVADKRKGRASKFTSHKRSEHPTCRQTGSAVNSLGTKHPWTANLKTLPATIVRKQDTSWQPAERKLQHAMRRMLWKQLLSWKRSTPDTKESSYKQPITVRVKINGKDVAMVVDTWAGVSSINEKTMCSLWPNLPMLQPADHMKFTSYTEKNNIRAGSIKRSYIIIQATVRSKCQ